MSRVSPTAAIALAMTLLFKYQPLHPIGSAWSALWAPVLFSTGLNPSSPIIFLLWVQIALPFVAWTLCGWIVTRVDIGFVRQSSEPGLVVRIHRDLAPLFAGSILVMNLLLIMPFIRVVGPRAYNFVGPLAVYTTISVLAILLGGSLRRDRSEPSSA